MITNFLLAAPNRLVYSNNEGSRAIVLGKRRWDKQGDGPWVPTTTTPLRLPAPFWTGPVRDARLLSRTPDADVVSFYDAGIRAWFEATIERRTGRTRRLNMITGSHFMHHVYSRFDAPVRIRPPR